VLRTQVIVINKTKDKARLKQQPLLSLAVGSEEGRGVSSVFSQKPQCFDSIICLLEFSAVVLAEPPSPTQHHNGQPAKRQDYGLNSVCPL
jgi:hypothetical protein